MQRVGFYLGGNMFTNSLDALWSIIGDFDINIGSGLTHNPYKQTVSTEDGKFKYNMNTGEISSGTNNIFKFDMSTGNILINNGKFAYSPINGINANNGSATMNSTDDNTEFEFSNVGRALLQRKNPAKQALLLEEHPDSRAYEDKYTTTSKLFEVKGAARIGKAGLPDDSLIVEGTGKVIHPLKSTKANYKDDILFTVEGAVSFEGTVTSPGLLKNYEKVENTAAFSVINSTIGTFYNTESTCTGSKVPLGGGCDMTGTTIYLTYRSGKITTGGFKCTYFQIAEENIDVTITAQVTCAVSVT